MEENLTRYVWAVREILQRDPRRCPRGTPSWNRLREELSQYAEPMPRQPRPSRAYIVNFLADRYPEITPAEAERERQRTLRVRPQVLFDPVYGQAGGYRQRGPAGGQVDRTVDISYDVLLSTAAYEQTGPIDPTSQRFARYMAAHGAHSGFADGDRRASLQTRRTHSGRLELPEENFARRMPHGAR